MLADKKLQPTVSGQDNPQLHYQIACPQPASHLFEVKLTVEDWQQPTLDLMLPVWTPGSYLVREYAKHLQDFSAQSLSGQPLAWIKQSKNHWQVTTPIAESVQISYRVYANELSVRTNHLDQTHAYFNPAALCFYLPGLEQQAIAITVTPPDQAWQVTTPLPHLESQPNTFLAPDFDTLVDSPFEIGAHAIYDFVVLGKPHQLAIWGEGNLDPARIIADTQKLIEVEADLFGGLPYDRYLFLLHLSSQGNGGLEHKTCCSLNYPRFGFRSEEKYNRFLTLVAHEFFHLWNVKRIRPQALEAFDYGAENYTPSLWFSEGTTSYYDQLFPLRAQLFDAKWYLKLVSESITRLQTTPGRRVQPASESSFDAWIKLYRPDANSRNAQISYYLKGELVSMLLDLLIRHRHPGTKSLDDVMRQMWQQFGQPEIGFSPAQLQAVIESVAGQDLGDFFACYVDGTAELPFENYLHPFGLELQAEVNPDDQPYLGMSVKTDRATTQIQAIDSGSPAEQAGLNVGDEVLAMAGFRITADQWSERLKNYQPGDRLDLTVFHQDQLRTCTLQLAEPIPTRYQIHLRSELTSQQRTNLESWLGEGAASLLAKS
ncbi:MAG: M61 family metallopeptidase [Aphanocapsa sp. GSE-SYN-MK-11-07L]|jgi:predicted metalloprotease with PDZ domain|nr:M61 family metallopeptidase [Aphanocapsa sp. GSE-SYN-MK-11-07L]